jgi:hypothetical protein
MSAGPDGTWPHVLSVILVVIQARQCVICYDAMRSAVSLIGTIWASPKNASRGSVAVSSSSSSSSSEGRSTAAVGGSYSIALRSSVSAFSNRRAASVPASSTSSTGKSLMPRPDINRRGQDVIYTNLRPARPAFLANVVSALTRLASSMEVEENGRVEARFTSWTLVQSPQK